MRQHSHEIRLQKSRAAAPAIEPPLLSQQLVEVMPIIRVLSSSGDLMFVFLGALLVL